MSTNSPILTIRPSQGWGRLDLRDLWEYRDLLWFNVWREVKAKYRQMALGPVWIVLQPIMEMVVFSFIFGRVARLSDEGIPYFLMVYVAMVPWSFFANASNQSVGSLVNQMGVISKVYFPRMIIPLSATLGGLVDFAISFSVFFLVMLIMGFYPGWPFLMMPVYLLLAMLTALAVGLWTASLTVRFRDFRLIVQYGTRLAMFMTPVAYSAREFEKNIPNWVWLYQLNPMYWVVEGFRWSLLGIGRPPSLYMLYSVVIVLVTLVSGAYLFRRTERSIVDLL